MSRSVQKSVLRLLGALFAQTMFGDVAGAASITLATYNVENYVAVDRRIDNAYRPAYPKPEAEKAALRSVIRGIDADVLAMQEMGAGGYLAELQGDLRAEGMDYPYSALAEAADAERHLAVLSRIPLRRVRVHADLDFRYFGAREKVKRGLLEIAVSVGDEDLTLFVVHLHSRFTERRDDPDSTIFRAGEAKTIRDYVLGRFPNPSVARFVIMGDCNDTRNSRPLRLLMRRGGTTIATLTKAVDRNGEAWTYGYHKEDAYSRVDFILVSPGLAPAVREGAARVYDGPGVGDASDHRPVVVRLDLSGGQPDSAHPLYPKENG